MLKLGQYWLLLSIVIIGDYIIINVCISSLLLLNLNETCSERELFILNHSMVVNTLDHVVSVVARILIQEGERCGLILLL